MKNHLITLSIVFSLIMISCKSKKETTEQTKEEVKTATVVGNTTGKISHKHRASGCSTIIITQTADGELILIPINKLPAELDTDGNEITFNYVVSRMPQPEGCSEGMPAEISDISKK